MPEAEPISEPHAAVWRVAGDEEEAMTRVNKVISALPLCLIAVRGTASVAQADPSIRGYFSSFFVRLSPSPTVADVRIASIERAGFTSDPQQIDQNLRIRPIVPR